MATMTSRSTELAATLTAGLRLADRAAISDIEQHAKELGRAPNGRRIYDLRPMLDPKTQCADALDMARDAVDWARARRLIAPAESVADVVVILRLDL